jgi:hypothetical protein
MLLKELLNCYLNSDTGMVVVFDKKFEKRFPCYAVPENLLHREVEYFFFDLNRLIVKIV